jgi:hypothetical protein
MRLVSSLACGISDGSDTCVDVDAYFTGLATALLECKPSANILIDLCG